MKIKNWDPSKGDAQQGDVILFRVPERMKLDTSREIEARDNRLILAEGEITGHHHAIWDRNPPTMLREDGSGAGISTTDTERMLKAATAKRSGTAKLYEDRTTITALVSAGELAHDRLAIGFLVVEHAPVVLRHDEHDAIRIPPGRYYVGRQAEYDGAEERRVQD